MTLKVPAFRQASYRACLYILLSLVGLAQSALACLNSLRPFQYVSLPVLGLARYQYAFAEATRQRSNLLLGHSLLLSQYLFNAVKGIARFLHATVMVNVPKIIYFYIFSGFIV